MRKQMVILMLVLLLGAPALAQEPTPEPTADVVLVMPDVPGTVTVENGGTLVINAETPAEPEPEGLSESVQVALIFGAVGIVIAVIGAYAYSKGKTPAELYSGLPGLVTQSLGPFLFSLLMQQAKRTADPLDDQALMDVARVLGYTVTTLPNGNIVLSRDPVTPPAPTSGETGPSVHG